MAEELKIRTLPRSNEAKQAKEEAGKESRGVAHLVPAMLFVIGLSGAAFAVYSLVRSQPAESKRRVSSASVDDRVTKYMQDAELNREMAAQLQKAENDQLMSAAGSRPQAEVWDPPKDRVYGLQLDQEDSAGQVLADLNSRQNNQPTEMLPEDRINARLSNSKWINEMERAEQKQFIANFIRGALENGYEITLNDQLVVVKVRKLPGNQKVSIDKILDQLARRPSSN